MRITVCDRVEPAPGCESTGSGRRPPLSKASEHPVALCATEIIYIHLGEPHVDRSFLAKPTRCRPRRNHLRSSADHCYDYAAGCAERGKSAITANRRFTADAHPNQPQPCPVAGIAFLWFIGVVREQLGVIEDRLFSTVFLGSGLLFLAMVFVGTVTSTSLMEMLAGANVNADIWAFGRSSTQALISVYAMRMAAVFTLSVSTLGLRTSAMPRWVSFLGYAVALVLLVAAGEHKWTQLVFPTWVLLVSVAILFTRPPARPSVPE